MSLSEFIRHHHREIIDRFEEFARTLGPVTADMSAVQLRDHAEELLTAIVADMDTEQSREEQTRKAEGVGTKHAMQASGRLHADARIGHRFTADQVLAEFRALRASVLRLYDDLGAGTDISGIRRFNEAIDEALTASIVRFAASVDLYRDQFIGILSHDLRTPLSAITAGAALLAMAGEGDPQRIVRVGTRMLNSAQRMNRLITDVLDLTRTRLGKGIPIRRTPADLQQICEQVVLELAAFHPSADIRYEAEGDLRGEWDADRLAQLVSNLVGNALEHGGDQRVTVVARGAEDDVLIRVHNDGRPIPEEVQPSIFEPFVRHVSGDTELPTSVGLGLFIARGIVVSHGGTISVSSTATEGTTFEARLPRCAEPVMGQ